ncbi:DUF6325 family protein [Leucobacter allii]|uniref:DUF6325 family protein n=1 Tax=Leucobacter allii TaxID=2932247 RepID=A0ABY4FNH2_9MICO|nr:DUF6325 family protein [Leucobacter allii]UOQ57828.1 DUF6325 family protein [Leucobacter allii]
MSHAMTGGARFGPVHLYLLGLPSAQPDPAAVELVYQRDLAEKTAASGAELLAYEQIPGPVVHALLDTIVAETGC